eukprot:CAMPEP_0182420158 /NCGR_PEP_ID=MMETSP1167-20130531/4727_1 /TAXON_ID=2988 /ORGANISM="Mallomonas Sp, Strain CCMP3275" /LENGTH=144 /DNA_ID=CAMNT_0024595693 /DNA_START=154 /DNA_END=588 /DNA_ORIENTATION=-
MKTCLYNFSNYSEGEAWKERNEKSGRPTSPHVTTYAFPVTAISSITNRATGIALTGGITGISLLALVGADVTSFMQCIGNMSVIGPLAKFSVSFPLIYHYAASMRHFAWDKYPEMLENEKVEQSSYALLGGSAALSAVFAVISI